MTKLTITDLGDGTADAMLTERSGGLTVSRFISGTFTVRPSDEDRGEADLMTHDLDPSS